MRVLSSAPVVPAFSTPSPAQEVGEARIDLNTHLVTDAANMFIVRVAGRSMERSGVWGGDELVVNRTLEPKGGSVVLEGELTVKRLRITPSGVILQAENPDFPDIAVAAFASFSVLAVAVWVLHRV